MREFVTGDPHFGHEGVCKFLRADGSKLRPWDSAAEMDEALVELWNETVGPKDKVYIVGDFCINRKALSTAARLHGDKILIKGNHDIFRLEEYAQYFRDIRACHVIASHRTILTHIPIHTSQLERWRLNIHGHLHSDVVEITDFVSNGTFGGQIMKVPDKRYRCVSMEQTGFKPVLLESVL